MHCFSLFFALFFSFFFCCFLHREAGRKFPFETKSLEILYNFFFGRRCLCVRFVAEWPKQRVLHRTDFLAGNKTRWADEKHELRDEQKSNGTCNMFRRFFFRGPSCVMPPKKKHTDNTMSQVDKFDATLVAIAKGLWTVYTTTWPRFLWLLTRTQEARSKKEKKFSP